ncbi:MAG: DUF421 domain-containing protein [Oscillospiraceae bacterium]
MIVNLLKIVISAIASILVLFLLAKLMGARQISQLSFFDYINGITIGSIAAELAVAGISIDALIALTAMIVYGLAAEIVSFSTNKSIALRRLFEGKPLILFDNDTLFEQNLMKAKLDVNEFLTHCRYEGFFDLSDIETAVLETNGQISILPKSGARHVTPVDLGLEVKRDKAVFNVIIDGKVMTECLKNTGNNEPWLTKQLQMQNVKASELILATCDSENTLTVYEKSGKHKEKDMFI